MTTEHLMNSAPLRLGIFARKILRRVSMMSVVLLSISTSLSFAADPIRQSVDFDIPPQSVESALLAFSTQADVQVMVGSTAVAGEYTSGVEGRWSVPKALSRLFENTNLTYETVGHTVTVKRIAAATKVESKERKQTRSHGVVDDPSALQIHTSTQTSTRAIEDRKNATRLEEILVTGSRLRRADDPASRVTMLDRARIDQLGVSNVADALNYVSQQPFSESGPRFGGSRVVQLRGLGLGTTLVLINGRRTVTSALLSAQGGFDLNTIPLAAVDRIEVLSESASAIYGTDAIGGIVNIVLKNEVSRPTVDLSYGTAEGGAAERRASLGFGGSSERLRTTVVLDYFDRDGLPGARRDFSANQDYRRFGGVDSRVTRANPGNVCSATGDNLPGLSSPCAAVPQGSSGIDMTPGDFEVTQGQRNLESLRRWRSVVAPSKRMSALLTAELTLQEQLNAFGEVLYSNRDDRAFRDPSSLSGRIVPASNPFNPFGADVRVDYLFSGLGAREERSKDEMYRAVAGLSGTAHAWDWEVSLLGIHEDGENYTLNQADTPLVNAALAAVDPARALNVFQDGPGGSPALLASLLAVPRVDSFSSKVLQAGGFIRGPLFALPTGRIDSVFGAEMRKEQMDLGVQSASLDLSAQRKSWSTYAELGLPLVDAERSLRFARRLQLTLAGRFDHYDDFGDTFNAQYRLEWKPTASVLLHGAYSTSFRAPPLFDLYEPIQSTAATVTDFDPRRNEAAVFTRTRGGNRELDAETAISRSFGIVWSPERLKTLKVGASYWSVKQDQRVRNLSTTVLIRNEAIFPERVLRNEPTPQDVALGIPGRIVHVNQTNLNFGGVETRGIDMQLSHALLTTHGQLATRLTATWVDTFRVADFPNTPAMERVGVASADGTVPRLRATASVGWNRHDLSLAATVRYVDSYEDVAAGTAVPNGRILSSQAFVDLQASFNVSESLRWTGIWVNGLTVRLGVVNLFNEEPQFSEVRGQGFDVSQADARQRFGYIMVSKSF